MLKVQVQKKGSMCEKIISIVAAQHVEAARSTNDVWEHRHVQRQHVGLGLLLLVVVVVVSFFFFFFKRLVVKGAPTVQSPFALVAGLKLHYSQWSWLAVRIQDDLYLGWVEAFLS